MAMFAEDIGLLPGPPLHPSTSRSVRTAASAFDVVFGLFREMNTPGDTRQALSRHARTSTVGCLREITPIELRLEELDAAPSRSVS